MVITAAAILTGGGVWALDNIPGGGRAITIAAVGKVMPPAGRPAVPTIKGPTLDGATLNVNALRGTVVLNVWGSWCVPCRTETTHRPPMAGSRFLHIARLDR